MPSALAEWQPHQLIATTSEFPVGCCAILLVLLGIILAVIFTSHRAAASTADQIRARTDFAAADVYVSAWDQHGLAIDNECSRLLIVCQNIQLIYPAGEVISVEVIADNVSLVKTNRGSQALGAGIGGLLLGPVGVVVGGLSGSTRSERRITRLVLRIVTTDFHYPCHDILLHESFDSKGEAVDSYSIQNAMNVATLWHSRVTALIRKASAGLEAQPKEANNSLADELRKLEELRRDGVLTDEEFNAQKRFLLDRSQS